VLLLSTLSAACNRGISFKRERIETTIVACDTLEIRGTYFFENIDSLPHTTSIYYPFPVDSILAYPHYIELKRSSGESDTRYIKVKKGMRWRMTVGAGETDSVVVTYRQKTTAAQGRYILTTTKYWGKPLKSAAFTVAVPDGITLAFWSFAETCGLGESRDYSFTCQSNDSSEAGGSVLFI
jgi:hypothetical protein